MPTDSMETLGCCKARFCRHAVAGMRLCIAPWPGPACTSCPPGPLPPAGQVCWCNPAQLPQASCWGVRWLLAGSAQSCSTDAGAPACAGPVCCGTSRVGCRAAPTPSSARTSAPAGMCRPPPSRASSPPRQALNEPVRRLRGRCMQGCRLSVTQRAMGNQHAAGGRADQLHATHGVS